jgi:alpha-tubulin suppressor-like RCC1 family protein
VWAWGFNSFGQLGNNSTVNRSSPVQVVGGHSFTEIAAGFGHSLALKANGEVWSWGLNGQGQLGDNSTVGKSSPIQVVGGHSFTKAAAGGSHSLALKANGEVWAWGNNSAGQLGENNIDPKSSPIQVNFYNTTLPLITNSKKTRIYSVTPNTSYTITNNQGIVYFNGDIVGFGDSVTLTWVD